MKLALCLHNEQDFQLIKYYISKHSKQIYHLEIEQFILNINTLDKLKNYDILIMNVNHSLINNIYYINKEIKIIYVSSHLEDALIAIENKAYYYLESPIKENKVYKLVQNLIKDDLKSTIKFIDIKQRQRSINIYDINFIEIKQKISRIHLRNKMIIETYKSLKSWIQNLDDSTFIRSHKSYLINIKQVKYIDKDIAYMHNDEYVYISRFYKKEFIKHFYEYLDLIK